MSQKSSARRQKALSAVALVGLQEQMEALMDAVSNKGILKVCRDSDRFDI